MAVVACWPKLAAAKAARDESARRARVARDNEAFALKHGLSPERIYQPQPQLAVSAGFGGLRPSPSPRELARRSKRVDQILFDLSSSSGAGGRTGQTGTALHGTTPGEPVPASHPSILALGRLSEKPSREAKPSHAKTTATASRHHHSARPNNRSHDDVPKRTGDHGPHDESDDRTLEQRRMPGRSVIPRIVRVRRNPQFLSQISER